MPHTPGLRRRSARLSSLILERRIVPAQFLVTSSADSGAGTLRQAVIDAGASAGADTIVFDPVVTSISLTGGQLAVTGDLAGLSIVGPGAGNLTLIASPTAGTSNRLFFVDVPGGSAPVSISGLTLQGGLLSAGDGGAVWIADEAVSFQGVRFSGSKAAKGGAVAVQSAGSLTLTDCTVAANTATTEGGGLYIGGNASITVSNCVFSGNSSAVWGGAISVVSTAPHPVAISNSLLLENVSTYGAGIRGTGPSKITVTASSLIGNSATNAAGGFDVNSVNLTLLNSTVADNQATYAPAGGRSEGGLITVAHSTIFSNSVNRATSGIAGLMINSSNVAAIISTIVAGNRDSVAATDFGSEFGGDIKVIGDNNIIGAGDVASYLFYGQNNLVGTRLNPLDPKLARSGDGIGAGSIVYVPRPGSPALNAGTGSAFNPTLDQRGLARTVGVIDIGAVEADIAQPVVTGSRLPESFVAGTAPVELVVTFADDIGINPATAGFGTGDIELTGPAGVWLPTFVAAELTNGNRTRARYSLSPPGGTWDAADSGRYTVRVVGSQVSDGSGNAVAATALGTVRVDLGPTLVVDSVSDADDGNYAAGQLSLREALAIANASKGVRETIRFDPAIWDQRVSFSKEIAVTDPVVIAGPGADRMTLSGQSLTRLFTISHSTATAYTTIAGLNLIQGRSAFGGLINSTNSRTRIESVTMTDSGEGLGGAICITGGEVTIADSLFARNFGQGGGVYAEQAARVFVRGSTFRDNAADEVGGGAIHLAGDAELTLEDSAVVNNSSQGPGGGLQIAATSGTARITGTTFSGNTATTNGGAINVSNGWLLLTQATVANNSAGGTGGGIRQTNNLSVVDSIVAGNLAPAQPDLSGSTTPTTGLIATNSLFGVVDPSTTKLTGSFTAGSVTAPLNTMLSPLGYFGGSTPSHVLLPGSPAIDIGVNPRDREDDQRGQPRVSGAASDLGATEHVLRGPLATATVAAVTVGGGANLEIEVTYADPDGINTSSIDPGDVRLTKLGTTNAATPFAVTVTGKGTSVVARYTFVAPGGTWDVADNAPEYVVTLLPSEVRDLSVHAEPSPVGRLAGFAAVIPSTFLVTSAADVVNPSDGVLSLREAIASANANSGVRDVITFDAGLSGQSIKLSGGTLTITDSLVMTGPGSGLLTIDGQKLSRVFTFNIVGTGVESFVSGLSIVNGSTSSDGGGIYLGNDALRLDGVVLADNSATQNGAGIWLSTGRLTVNNSTLTRNSTSAYGGAISAVGSSSGTFMIEITESRISANSARFDGGGLHFGFGTAILRRSTVDGNIAARGSVHSSGILAIENTTIAHNTASTAPGLSVNSTTTLTLTNSTIARNTATSSSGGLSIGSAGGSLTLQSSIIAGNYPLGQLDVASATTIPVTIAGSNNIIGVGGGFFVSYSGTNSIGSSSSPIDAKLAPFGLYGGPLPTLPPRINSPVLNAGSNVLNLTTDQRGTGYPRAVGQPDIGAIEGVWPAPVGMSTAADVRTAGGSSYVVTVDYDDDTGVDITSIGIDDVSLVGPAGMFAATSATAVTIGSVVRATYTFAAPGGTWDDADNGTYSLIQNAGAVLDVDSPTPHGSVAASLATFTVLLPRRYVVDVVGTTDDGKYGVGQLAFVEAVKLANANKNLADTITFDPSVFGAGSKQSISSKLTITDSLTIESTVNPVTFSGAGPSFIFNSLTATFTLKNVGFDLLGGPYASVSGIDVRQCAGLTLDRVTVSRATSREDGAFLSAGCPVSITDSSFSAFTSDIINVSSGSLTIRNSTLTGMKVGIRAGDSTQPIRIENCTITGASLNGVRVDGVSRPVDVISSVIQSTSIGAPALIAPNLTVTNSVVGSVSATTFSQVSSYVGTMAAPFDAKLGPTITVNGMVAVPPRPDSPLVDAGANPSNLAFDQRGAGYPRTVGGKTDIGAFEGVSSIPIVESVSIPVPYASGSTAVAITVTYRDDLAISAASLGTGDLTVKLADNTTVTPTFLSATPAGDGPRLVATYLIAAPGGTWTAGKSGPATISLVAGEVLDTSANAVTAVTFPAIKINVGTPFVVDEVSALSDGDLSPGHLSLREAIELANQFQNMFDRILFDPTAFAASSTITLGGSALLISDQVAIEGPSAGLTLNAGGTSSLFRLDQLTGSGGTVTLSGMRLTQGKADFGGAIQNVDMRLTLDRMTLLANSAQFDGGAIHCATTSATVSASSTFFSGNTAGRDGGAVWGQVTSDASTFANNVAGRSGGAIATAGAAVTLQSSTLSGNTAGMFGGAFHGEDVTVTATFATLADNVAAIAGGGIATFAASSVTLTNSVLDGNVAPIGPDFTGAALANATLISDPRGAIVSGSANLLGVSARLLPLANNGGPTPTRRPAPGSPLRDIGPTSSLIALDQRGTGYARITGDRVDLGAVESADTTPIAHFIDAPVTINATTTLVRVQYRGASAINVATLDGSDLVISGPGGFSASATFVGHDSVTGIATYSVAAPGGTWESNDFGTYTVVLAGGAVSDVATEAVPGGVLGRFTVTGNRVYVVDKAGDSVDGNYGPGQLTLREAIEAVAASLASANTITFDPATFNNSTLSLTGGPLLVRSALSLSGFISSSLTLSGSGLDRILFIDTPVTAKVVVSDLQMTGGSSSAGGGAVSSYNSALDIQRVRFTGNSAGNGGGLYHRAGSLTVAAAQFTNNSASGDGGGLYVSGASTATLTAITISGNTATLGGGAFFDVSKVTLAQSAVYDNSAGNSGGGIAVRGDQVSLQNVTLSGNTAFVNGGGLLGIAYASPSTKIYFDNTTIAWNTATTGTGGAFLATASTTVRNTILAYNFSPGWKDAVGSFFNSYSSLGDSERTADYAGKNNNRPAGEDPLVLPLANNGGPTLSHALASNSPLLDKGSNLANLATDQRGPGFLRVVGSAPDIGSIESDVTPPTAKATLSTVTIAGATLQQITVSYSDNAAVNVATLGTGDVRITGPGGFDVFASLASFSPSVSGPSLTAVYEFTPPGGAWDPTDYGNYSVNVVAGAVLDTFESPITATSLGTINVRIAETYVVTNTADSGPGSLRAALTLGELRTGVADVITFDPALFSTPQTITLTTGSLSAIDPVMILGPGADKLTITAAGNSRILTINPLPSTTSALTLESMTLTGGFAAPTSFNGNGGAIYVIDTDLTLRDVVLTGNAATLSGGAVWANSTAILIERATILANSAGLAGGVNLTGKNVTVRNSTIRANTADSHGGAYFYSSSTITIDSTEVSDNVAGSGGGLRFQSVGVLNVLNSTISGNRATDSATGLGGGLAIMNAFQPNIVNSTIAGNFSAANGGGIYTNTTSKLYIRGSIVFGNTATNGPDISTFAIVASDAIIGSGNGFGFADDSGTNVRIGINPLLAPLAANGGVTRTHALLAGSPAINTGSNTLNLANDQRGAGYPRTYVLPDVGAYEYVGDVPVALANVGPVTKIGPNPHTFTVTYFDNLAIDVSKIGTGDIRVSGPFGYSQLAELVSVSDSANGTPRVATYRIPAPGGQWDPSDAGTYTVTMLAGEVTDTTSMAVPAGQLAQFTVATGNVFLVANTNDTGAGSLRAAITAANSSTVGLDVITFDPIFFSVPRTITVVNTPLDIRDSVSIVGPGRDLLTISGGGKARMIAIESYGPSLSVILSGVTLSGGSSAFDGGAIAVSDDSLTLSNIRLTGNTGGNGGAIYMTGPGALNIEDSEIADNRATRGGGIYVDTTATHVTITRSALLRNTAQNGGGGAAMIAGSGSVTLDSTTLSDNYSRNQGGAIYGVTTGSSWNIRNSLFHRNTAGGNGGAVYFGQTSATLTVRNSTFVANSAIYTNTPSYGLGGAIAVFGSASAKSGVTVTNSTVTDNSALNLGGGIYITPGMSITLTSSIVAGNSGGVLAPDLRVDTALITSSALGSDAGYQLGAGSGSNLPVGANLLLGPLADNGGPTWTRELLPGSPALEAGENPANLVTDQRGFSRTSGAGTDIGAYERQIVPAIPPTTATLTINDGAAQRSTVRSVTVTFSAPVAFPLGYEAAVSVYREGPGGPLGIVNLQFATVGNSLIITFDDPFMATAAGLIDGRYTLTVVADNIVADGGFDGNGDGSPGDNGVRTFHRLFGDANGDATVNATDFLAFRLAFLSSDPAFDYNGNGTVDSSDFMQFRLRFLQSV